MKAASSTVWVGLMKNLGKFYRGPAGLKILRWRCQTNQPKKMEQELSVGLPSSGGNCRSKHSQTCMSADVKEMVYSAAGTQGMVNLSSSTGTDSTKTKGEMKNTGQGQAEIAF